MVGFFGPAMQNGYVVENLDAALEYWTNVLGVGPFFKSEHINLEYYEFNGKACDIDFSVALSYWGDLQIELIEQHNDTPTPYVDFLKRHGPGLHHVACQNGKPLDENLKYLASLGHTPTTVGKVRNGGRFVYFDMGGHAGTTVEIGDASPALLAYFERMRLATIAWDGSDAVRPSSSIR